jgi:hypothetical protein
MNMGLQLPVAPLIPKTKDPNFPHLYFEYHQSEGKVYAVEIPGRWEGGKFTPALDGQATGEKIAEHCDNHAQFIGFVQTYLRGYKKALLNAGRILAK